MVEYFTIPYGFGWAVGYTVCFLAAVIWLFIYHGAPRTLGEWFSAWIGIIGLAVAAMFWPLVVTLGLLALFSRGIQMLWRWYKRNTEADINGRYI